MIAVKFCCDDPPESVVDKLTRSYLASGTDITAVLRTLIASPEFQASAGMKVRTPCEDIVAAVRALDVSIAAPSSSPVPTSHVAMQTLYTCMTLGQEPFNWPQPNGAPIDNYSWLSPSRLIGSFNAHFLMSYGLFPTNGATYHPATYWLPSGPARLDDVVDYVSQRLLVSKATPSQIQAVCQALGYAPSEVITASHPVTQTFRFGHLLATLLDSSSHLTR